MLSLIIKGEPRPKQSARFYSKGGKMFSYQTNEIKKTTESIQMQVLSQLPTGFKPYSQPLKVKKALFVFPPLKGFSKQKLNAVERETVYKSTKPDLHDNLFKNLMDSLEGIIFINDSQIVMVENASKIYGMVPRTEITFEEIEKPG